MSKEDQHLEGNEEDTSTSDEESETNDEELDDFFKEENGDEPVTRAEYENLKKGTQKLATELGRLKKGKEVKKEVKTETKETKTSPILKSLYFKSNPEAETVWEEVEKEAKTLNKDPFELYEQSSFFKGEAKVKFKEKENLSKVDSPSSGIPSGKRSLASIDLKNPDDVKWLNAKEGRRQQYMDWFAKH